MRPHRLLAALVVAATAVAGVGLTSTLEAPPAQAADASQFEAGNIISDQNMYAGNAMSAEQVQAFILAQNSRCASGYTCLFQYAQTTPTMAANAYCTAIPGSASESAASIIARIGAACNISQRVLLVLLQKEQTLVTHQSPSGTRYSSATGFACPDTAACDSSYGGFFYQVYYAARQYQVYKAFPNSFNHRPGAWNNVLFNPNAACGSSRVFIQNSATAGLYNYTPYQPNAAALRNLYGTGDSCSAYGNRNFWRMYTDWFGDPRLGATRGPVGTVDAVTASGLSVSVRGWALDPDAPGPVAVHIYANGPYGVGTGIGVIQANQPRPDLVASYPNHGPNHGYSQTITVPTGTREVCMHAMDLTGDPQNLLGCRAVTPVAGTPLANYELATNTGTTATVRGWAFDPDASATVEIHAYLNGPFGTGTGLGVIRANASRPDVATAYPGATASQGFQGNFAIPVGTSTICLYAMNAAGLGDNAYLGCRQVSTGSGPPRGSIDYSAAGIGSVALSGWALDPDTTSPVQLRILVDGQQVQTATANTSRPDVGRAYPGYGDAHGYSLSVPVAGGTHQVCVVAVNQLAGSDTQLGCREITVPAGDPIGQFSIAQAGTDPSTAWISGWTIDPDTASPTSIHVYVNGRWGGQYAANVVREDVARAYPNYGANHGFSANVPITAGRNEICVYAIGVPAPANNPVLGCRVVTTASGAPFGNFEAVSVSGSTATLAGWTIDPEVVSPVTVGVTVNGAEVVRGQASGVRDDVARVHPGYGSNHGLQSLSFPVPTGSNTVCVTAYDAATSAGTSLGCRLVTR